MEPYNEDTIQQLLLAALLGIYVDDWETLESFAEREILGRHDFSAKTRAAFKEVFLEASQRAKDKSPKFLRDMKETLLLRESFHAWKNEVENLRELVDRTLNETHRERSDFYAGLRSIKYGSERHLSPTLEQSGGSSGGAATTSVAYPRPPRTDQQQFASPRTRPDTASASSLVC
ncbi:hypothetical protein [Stigmatella erecta]|uniref:hypothetical protein n=1 Tax=Stigmatella erecta TaxID=83460 RepID=UPI0011601D5C|nr:hypothetical protein [Stigmatella erecta]